MVGEEISAGPEMAPLAVVRMRAGIPKKLRFDLSQDGCQHRAPRSVSPKDKSCINLGRRLKRVRALWSTMRGR